MLFFCADIYKDPGILCCLSESAEKVTCCQDLPEIWQHVFNFWKAAGHRQAVKHAFTDALLYSFNAELFEALTSAVFLQTSLFK